MKRVRMMALYAGPERSVAIGETAEFDDAEARGLVDGGYGVYADELRPARKEPAEKPIERWTVAELQAYAADHDIDLGDATVKAGILKVVVTAIEAARDSDGD
ncbi:hypothetical protein OG244_19450 [Streptomyces brevispora]|uniref:hypothetical protein n=1 Tax=Streptomyces brevispora TaxID=887462 RepID=UPI002E31F15F|nr:hypothetical protein [Streptomyces brevispora]